MGLAGGDPGAVGENWLLPQRDEAQAQRLPARCMVKLTAGDVLRNKSGNPTGVSLAPRQLGELLDDIHHRFAGQITSAMEAATQALAAGLTEIEVVWDVPLGEEDAAGRLLAFLEQADDFARQGLLLELPATPSMAELRRRLAAEVVAATTRPL